jgi:Ca2+/Na+ antiporter
MSTGTAFAVFAVSLVATLVAAAVFADRLDVVGHRLELPEALIGLLTAVAADAPELSSAVAALVTGAQAVGVGVVVGSNVFNLAAMLGLSASSSAACGSRPKRSHGGGVALGVTSSSRCSLRRAAGVGGGRAGLRRARAVRRRRERRRGEAADAALAPAVAPRPAAMGGRDLRSRVASRDVWGPLMILPPASR